MLQAKWTLKQETTQVSRCRCPCGDTYTLKRYAVRKPDGELYGYSSTWFGGYRLLCSAMGWSVPT